MTTVKDKLRNPFIQQYLLEILLPFAGYLFFDWSLVIIAAFYFLDHLASEVFFVRRLSRITKESDRNKAVVGIGICVSLLTIVAEGLLIYYLWIHAANENELIVELTNFAVDELWLLFPLVLLVYYMKDQMTFNMPRRFVLYHSGRYMNYHVFLNSIALAGVAVMLLIIAQTDMHDLFYLLIFVGLKLLYDFTLVKWADKKSQL